MNMIFVILVGAAALLVWGVLFVIRGYETEEEEKVAVPISDINEIRQIKKGLVAPSTPATSDVAAVAAKSVASTSVPIVATGAESEIEKLRRENAHLTDALRREVLNKKTAGTQIDDAQHAESALLKQQCSSAQEMVAKLELERTELQRSLEQSIARCASLEDALQSVEKELSGLKAPVATIPAVATMPESSSSVVAENGQLRESLRLSQAELATLRDDLHKVRAVYEQRIQDALKEHQGVPQSVDAQQTVSAAVTQNASAELSEAQRLIAQLTSEKQDVSAAMGTLEAEVADARERILQIQKKEHYLQYELTKSRAQAVGLQRICEDFKEHIAELHRGSVV